MQTYETKTVPIIPGEVVPITADASRVMAPDDVVTDVAATVYEATGLLAIPDAVSIGSPMATGQILNLTIDGRKLRARDRYRLVALATIDPDAKIVGIVVPIECVT